MRRRGKNVTVSDRKKRRRKNVAESYRRMGEEMRARFESYQEETEDLDNALFYKDRQYPHDFYCNFPTKCAPWHPNLLGRAMVALTRE